MSEETDKQDAKPGVLGRIVRWLIFLVSVALVAVCVHAGPYAMQSTLLDAPVGQVHVLVVLAGVLLGLASVLSMCGPKEGLVIFALVGGGCVPWVLGFLDGLSPGEILQGENLPIDWPWFIQPAFLVCAIMLPAALLVTRGRKKMLASTRLVLTLAAATPGVLVAYDVTHLSGADGNQGPGPISEDDVAWDGLDADLAVCGDLINPDQALGDMGSAFSSTWRPRTVAALELRFPAAAWVVGELADPNHFDVWFQMGTSDWSQVVTSLSSAVHESVHMLGFQAFDPRSHRYPVDVDTFLSFETPSTMDRSRILEELPGSLSDLSYNQTYLTGDSGAQGYALLLDEFNAYTWSLLTELAFADQRPSNMTVSARDGILAFMLYLETYLALAQSEEPSTYEAIVGSAEIRAVTIALWDRAACALTLSEGVAGIGQRDREIASFVFSPERLQLVEALR